MPQLLDDDLIYHKAVKERCFLITVPSGKVECEVSVLTRHFGDFAVDFA